MLSAINISKNYNDGARNDLHVLKDINFTLQHGETSAIIGTSGSGKTTLLNILGGLDEPNNGQVLLNDVDVHKLSEKQRCKFALLIKEKALCFALGMADVKEIDQINILQASLLAMKRAGADLIITYHALDAARWLAAS